MKSIVFSAALFALLFAVPARAQAQTLPSDLPTADQILQSIRPGHPRVMLTSDRLADLRHRVKDDPAVGAIAKDLLARADKMLREPVVEYKLEGPRLLTQSRRAVEHISTCAMAYLISGERKYADRAIADMTAAAAFPDWHPVHFLDTAEMSCAMGVGYDWLYDTLSSEQRDQFAAAIANFGLTPGLASYRGREKYGWWTKVSHNWSLVCNGGLAVGALAIADRQPAMAGEVLAAGLRSAQSAFHHFDSAGGWDEGPGYWGYATEYAAFYLAALQTATGSTYDIPAIGGFDRAGDFRMAFVGPSHLMFNFADAGEGAGTSPQMYLFAELMKRPVYAAFERGYPSRTAFDLLWYSHAGSAADLAVQPLGRLFPQTAVAFLRSGPQPTATWVGFKGGDNRANHSHLDLGTFVLDSQGQRFVSSLGGDNYNLPGYFGAARWTYYRLGTIGQNTLLVNDANQDLHAKAPIVAFASDGSGCSAIADLSAGYPACTKVLRGITVTPDGCAIVQDEIGAASPVQVAWQIHTRATVSLGGADTAATGAPEAVLTLAGKVLRVRLLSPGGALLTMASASPPTPQNPNTGITKLVVRLPKAVSNATITVAFVPADTTTRLAPPPALARWPGWKQ